MRIVTLMFAILILTGCLALGDPLGATTRADRDARARERIAEVEAQARVDEARALADGRARVAESQADAQIYTARTWAMVAPVLLVILVVGVVVGIGVWWAGRSAYARSTMGTRALLPGDPGFYGELRRIAREDGAQIDVRGDTFYLDGKAVRMIERKGHE